MRQWFVIGLAGLGVLTSLTSLAAPTATELRSQGLAYREQGQFSAAIASFQQSLALDPDSLAGHVLLGWTHHKANQDAEAAVVLQQALALDPLHVPAWNALGIVYLVHQDYSASVAAHSWAAWLKPDNEIAYYNLSLALQGLQEDDWARITGQIAGRLEPDNPHPWIAVAIATWNAGDTQIASQSFQQAIRLDSRYQDPAFLNYLDEAGFSPLQIQTAQKVLSSLKPNS